MPELHIFEDERGNDGPDWGVYHGERCCLCLAELVIVCKVDRRPEVTLCREHWPLLTAGDGTGGEARG